MYYIDSKNKSDTERRDAFFDNLARRYSMARQRRTMAAIADFATNLLSIIGRKKGMRYNIATPQVAPAANEGFEKMRDYYLKNLVDYGGSIASDNLKKGTANWGPQTTQATPQPQWPMNSPTPNNWYGAKGRDNLINDIKNIQPPVWHINNKKNSRI